LNEVGGDPQRFGGSPDQFHEANRLRLERWPYAMLATSTHDTKRGEDARARLNILSEIPKEYRRLISQWARLNASHRTDVHGEKAPSRNVEYLFYQALLGAWPAGHLKECAILSPAGRTRPLSHLLLDARREHATLVQRMQDYMLKAVKEAKVHSSWINPNADYDRAVADFVHKTLAGPRAVRFLESFLPFQQRVAKLGMVNSLSQVLLKLVSPGVPDIYQGTELWDFSLVDPDNRRPVDFAHRLQLLNELESLLQHPTPSGRLTEMLEHWEDGRIKLLLVSSSLRLRRRFPQVFQSGEYVALSATGEKADHVVSILRRHEDQIIVAVVPRLVASIFTAKSEDRKGRSTPINNSQSSFLATSVRLPIGYEVWKDTRLKFHSSIRADCFHNVLTGERVRIHRESDQASLNIADALSVCPIALLQSMGK
jgi:(1->4)-alpha-D-glucan 1-alpha-D-glucosylmutase